MVTGMLAYPFYIDDNDVGSLGVAFTGLSVAGAYYRPAASIKFKGTQVTANFGFSGTEFKFPPSCDYRPVYDGDESENTT